MGQRKRRFNVRHHAFKIFHHIHIAKAQDLIAWGATVIFSAGIIINAVVVIINAVVVARSVYFDDEVQFPAEEVGEVRADGHLAAELMAEFAGAEVLPQ